MTSRLLKIVACVDVYIREERYFSTHVLELLMQGAPTRLFQVCIEAMMHGWTEDDNLLVGLLVGRTVGAWDEEQQQNILELLRQGISSASFEEAYRAVGVAAPEIQSGMNRAVDVVKANRH